MTTPHRMRAWRDERGQSLIEFALASVLFFLTVFATIEFGLAVYRYNMLADLAQEGARWAAVHGKSSDDPGSATALQAFIDSRSPGFAVTATAIPANPSAVSPGLTIEVTVTTTFAPVTSLIPVATFNLASTARMIVFR